MKKLNLNELETSRRTVERDGVEYVVKPITPRVVYIADAAESLEGAARIRALVEAVALLVPDLPDPDTLTMKQLYAIVELSGKEAQAVEEAADVPKATSPAEASGDAISSAASS